MVKLLLSGCLPQCPDTPPTPCQDSFGNSSLCLTTSFSEFRCRSRGCEAERRRSGAGERDRWVQRLPRRRTRDRGTRGPEAAASPGCPGGSSLSYARRPSSTALSHVAGIQAGGALFPLEISDKNPFPPPFPPPGQDMGVGPQSRRVPRAGGCREPPTPNPGCRTKGCLGLGAPPAAGSCSGAWHLPWG